MTRISTCVRLSLLILGAACISRAIESLEFAVERIDSDDIEITQSSLLANAENDDWQSTVSIARTFYEIDYRPVSFDFRGISTRRKEHNTSLQINARRTLDEGFWLLIGAGVYEGFTDYRSLWLDEYFKQQYSDIPDSVPGDAYVFANPKGFNTTVGGRWEYRPGNGYAQLTLSRLQDDVSPGYEIDFDGLRRGELVLATTAASVSTENILSKRLRSLFEIRASKTSARSTRYGAQFSLNAAVGERIVWQTRFGGATENPNFDAKYANSKIEYNIADTFAVYLDANYYEDTGEISNTLLFTTAAPEVVSRRAGAGLRWTTDDWTCLAYFSQASHRYENAGPNAIFFSNLYQDRDWNLFKIAFRKTF